jgi:hypothetical protein
MLESTKAKVKPDWETPMTASCCRPSSTEAIWILDRRRRPVPVLVDGAEQLGPDPFLPSRCLLFRRVNGEQLVPSLSPPIRLLLSAAVTAGEEVGRSAFSQLENNVLGQTLTGSSIDPGFSI